MDLLASVSRSSGLQSDGDELKKSRVQEDYRKFVQTRLDDYLRKHPLYDHIENVENRGEDSQKNTQSNILILFRKLREGLMASKRLDDFALEVYEISFFLSIIFRIPAQTTSISGQLLPLGSGQSSLYKALRESHSGGRAKSQTQSINIPNGRDGKLEKKLYRPPALRQGREYSNVLPQKEPAERAKSIALVPKVDSEVFSHALFLLHILCHSYPSQASFHSHLKSIPTSIVMPRDMKEHSLFAWLRSMAAALTSHNYIRFEKLSRTSIPLEKASSELGEIALRCLLFDLRGKVRQTVWPIMRSAYRELDTILSTDWISRSLLLADKGLHGQNIAEGRKGIRDNAMTVEQWLTEQAEGEVQKKEGIMGRWILRR
ncbi:hypothetical protein M422DRAFT_29972 [Sphaerobolus stellatus SS14]|uniref:Uncharacterized protein n=1 Tax=Sphaerobolus stellatus (strain SS14) TaxID=990650 RepID=A0A0C9UQB4_SPHS4|nr:hypothetical protein M422DRAFT_29972 [Sphaerobolus stellatus SS14]